MWSWGWSLVGVSSSESQQFPNTLWIKEGGHRTADPQRGPLKLLCVLGWVASTTEV